MFIRVFPFDSIYQSVPLSSIRYSEMVVYTSTNAQLECTAIFSSRAVNSLNALYSIIITLSAITLLGMNICPSSGVVWGKMFLTVLIARYKYLLLLVLSLSFILYMFIC